MAIKIDLFEFPTKEEMLPLLQESPLYNIKSRVIHLIGLTKNFFGLIN